MDAELIEQSIAKQSGVLPAAQGELPYWEWSRLVGGLMDDTPLGRVVAVRSERDRERIKQFSPWQRRVRAEWATFRAKKALERPPEQLRSEMAQLEKALARMFGGDS